MAHIGSNTQLAATDIASHAGSVGAVAVQRKSREALAAHVIEDTGAAISNSARLGKTSIVGQLVVGSTGRTYVGAAAGGTVNDAAKDASIVEKLEIGGASHTNIGCIAEGATINSASHATAVENSKTGVTLAADCCVGAG